MNNPIEMIKMLMNSGKTPQEVAMQMANNNNNPVLQNLIKMANEGNTKGVEEFARNMFKEQGRDFDTELKDLKKIIGNFK